MKINIDFQGGTPNFKYENGNETWIVMGVFPKIFP